jgi:uncharacterized protein HemX
MKSNKIPIVLLLLVFAIIIAGLIHLHSQMQKITQQLTDNQRTNAEIEKAKTEIKLLALQAQLQQQILPNEERRQIGFRTESES